MIRGDWLLGSRHSADRLGQSLVRAAGDLVVQLWPAYLLASVSILLGFEWGLPDGTVVPRSWQSDENAAVWAVQQISFPFFHPRWLPWGTALFYQVFALAEIVSLGGFIELGDRGVLVIGRLVVYASAIGAVTVAFLLGRRLFDAWTGRATALLLAASPGFVITGHYFKVEVPMTFFLVLTLLAVFRMRDSAAIRDVAIVGLLVGYTASTQYSGGLIGVAAAAALFQAKLADVRRAVKVLVGATLIGFLVGTPYALLDPRAFYSGLQMDLVINHAGNAYTPARPPAWADYVLNVFPYAVTVPILVVAGIGLVSAIARERARLLPIWAFLGAYLLLLGLDNSRIVRATVPVLPIVALLAAYGLNNFRQLHWMRIPALICVTALAGYAFLFSVSYVKAFADDDPRVQASFWFRDRIPAGTPVAVSTSHYLDIPQLKHLGYRTVEVGNEASLLRSAASRYLVLSDMALLPRRQALAHYPDTAALLDYVRSDYCELAHFENSQRLAGVEAKPRDGKLPFDWLYANPRITILERREAGAPCRRFEQTG